MYFFDAESEDGDVSHMVLQYEDPNEEGADEDPVACYSFQMKDFYEFMALYLNDMEFNEEVIEEEEEYGPIHHLAHLLFHIVEEGKDLEV